MYYHHFSNFSRPPVPEDLSKYSAPRHFGFLKVLLYMDMAAILVNRPPPFSQSFVLSRAKEAPYENKAKLAQRRLRRSCLKMLMNA